jgi:N-acetylneuraminate synthase
MPMEGPTIAIGGRSIGAGHPVYVVAELSANHHQNLETARSLVRAAAEAGADAVKFQTYTPDTLTLDVRTGPFRIEQRTLWDGLVLHDLYKQAQMPWEWHRELGGLADDLGIQWFSTPFDATAVEYLESLSTPAYKIASFELVDLALLQAVARTGKPILLSTGMAALEEIDEAVRTIREAGSSSVALLRTNSAYPAPPEEMDLRTLPHLSHRFDLVVGLSDHTLGVAVPVAAVALGASIVEKHLTLSREVPGPDAAFSLEPAELAAMVSAIRVAERALGGVRFGPSPHERASLPFRRSLFVVCDVAAGEPFTTDNVRSIRPASGLHPRHLPEILERRAARDIVRGTPLTWDLVE